MNVQEAINHFVQDRGLERNLSPLTVISYQSTLYTVLRPTLSTPIKSLSADTLKLILQKRRRTLARSTYQQVIAILKLFSRWAHETGLWPEDYLKRYRTNSVKRKLPTFLDSAQDIMEMASLLNPVNAHDMRDRAMLLVSYAAALRPTEMLNLRLRDYLPTHHPPALHVQTLKRGKDRYVMLFPQAHQALEEYLSLARAIILAGRKDPKWLFVSNSGIQMNYAYWYSKVIALAQAASIPVHVTPHVLRHSAATHLARGGMSPWALQEFLGHVDSKSTGVYVHMLDRDVIEGYRKAMPLYQETPPEAQKRA